MNNTWVTRSPRNHSLRSGTGQASHKVTSRKLKNYRCRATKGSPERKRGSVAVSWCTLLVLVLVCLILPQTAQAAQPVAKDITSKVIKDTQNSTLNTLKLQASDADADTLSYTVLNLPAHGQLKEEATGQQLTTAPYILSSNKLKYIPEPGFTGSDSFTYKANDGISDSNAATVSINVTGWFAPIGIPEPPFGIKETYRMYDDPAKRNPSLTYTQNSEGGYYTHYIDNTHPSATDTSNPYGTASKPRKTIPMNLVAGSVVELHGSYNSGVNDFYVDRGAGTADKPIFVRSAPGEVIVINGRMYVRESSYMIFENLDSTPSASRVYNGFHVQSSDHIALRNSEVHHDRRGSGAGIVSVSGSNVVIYNNHIHHNNASQETQGVIVGTNAQYVWIVDNHIHDNGDGIMANAAGSAFATEGWPIYIYIGRNVIHDDLENAIDLKDSEHVIISQNEIYNYWNEEGLGTAIVLANEGNRVGWVLFNDIYDSKIGVRSNDDNVFYESYVIGNKIHNISGPAMMTWKSGAFYALNNVIYNVRDGTDFSGRDDARSYFINNIVSDPTRYYFNIYEKDEASLAYDIFYHGSDMVWSGRTYTSLTDFQSATGEGEGCVETDPQFLSIDSSSPDFLRPSSTSTAIDSGTGTIPVIYKGNQYASAYELFEILYPDAGSIKVDCDGNPRPQGSGWDIGAYEYTPQGAFLYGDVSGNGEISAYDAALTAQYAVGLITLTPDQIKAADVSGNGEVSAYDAALIAQYAVGLIDRFPVEG